MIEISQVLILGIFLIIWGCSALVKPNFHRETLAGLVVIFLGQSLFMGGIISYLTPRHLTGELFLLASLITISGLILILVKSFPAGENGYAEKSLSESKLPGLPLKSLNDLSEFIKVYVNSLGQAPAGQQILFFFFLLVVILLIQLT